MTSMPSLCAPVLPLWPAHVCSVPSTSQISCGLVVDRQWDEIQRKFSWKPKPPGSAEAAADAIDPESWSFLDRAPN